MAFTVGGYDIQGRMSHNVQTMNVGTDSIMVSGFFAKGNTDAISAITTMSSRFKYAGRYARFVIPGGSADTIQDLSPNSSVYNAVTTDEGTAYYAVDEFTYNPVTGRPDIYYWSLRMTRIRSSIDK